MCAINTALAISPFSTSLQGLDLHDTTDCSVKGTLKMIMKEETD